MEKAGIAAWGKEADFLGDGTSMINHFWRERGTDKKRRGINWYDF